ncbi:uncharacterized protein LOC129281824 [Lytechinus pictus]|uniref:uncharacterized protein LOC129281824 n=1 Tax=Lytechinus pictus TaxID=7653 RepID=UPI0030BA18AD
MTGTGITLSERFKGLNPWKLPSLEREFEHRSTSNLSFNEILKLSSLEITVNGESKSGHSKVASAKKYSTTSLHKLFSQKPTKKEAKFEKQKSNSKETRTGQKKRIDQSRAEKVKQKKSVEKPGGAIQRKPGNDKTLNGSKQMKNEPSKGLSNQQQSGVTPSVERPRDPRLLYGKGTYSVLAKKAGVVSQSVKAGDGAENSEKSGSPAKSGNPGKSEQADKPGNHRKLENQDKIRNPVKKKKSFEDSLLSGSVTGLEGVGKKSDGDKTIKVVKRNAVTKEITGVVEMTLKKKPEQNTDQNKPQVKEYHSSHNALKRIAESKKAEEVASAVIPDADKIPIVVKGILKKNNPSVDLVETTEQRLRSTGNSSTKGSGCDRNAVKEDQPIQSIMKQSATPEVLGKGDVNGSTNVTKPKQDVKNQTISVAPNTPNIVLKFSITPSIDNGKINLTVVSSSEDDQETPNSKEQKEQVDIPLSIENSSKAATASVDEPKDLGTSVPCSITDEELKKGSPIEVRISNGVSGQTKRSCTNMGIHNQSPTTVANNAHTCMNGSKPQQSPVASSGCVYTTARKTAQVSTHQSVVQVNNRPPVPISYVYGTVVSPRKTRPDQTKAVPTPHQKDIDLGGPQVPAASTENMPITVCIQKNMQTSNKVIKAKESPSKPVHRTLTAIARASEQDIESAGEKVTVTSFEKKITEGDNLEVVDMDISTPAHNAPSSNEGISTETEVPSISIGKTLEPHSTVLANEETNVKNGMKESQTTEIQESKVICSSAVSNMESSLEVQLEQVSNWTTYLHEDTNSPLKSAFGSKQSFKEALSSLKSTMQTSSHSRDLDESSDEATIHNQAKEIQKGPSLSIEQPTFQVGVATHESRLAEKVVSTVGCSVPKNISEVSGNAEKPGCTLPLPCLDVPTAVPCPNRADENVSVQNTSKMEITNASNVESEKGNVTCVQTNPQEAVSDERNTLPLPKSIKLAKSGNGDKLEPQEKISAMFKDNVVDICEIPRVDVINKAIFEEALKQSKSPGTPVEDEYSDQGPFETQSTTKIFTSSDIEGHMSKRFLEENNNYHVNRNHLHYGMKEARNGDQSAFQQSLNRGNNRYPDSPRNGPKPVYMRELSNVSDISMGDEFDNVGDDYNQEAVEPLLVRGSTARDIRRTDHTEYPRNNPRISRRDSYEQDGDYAHRSMTTHSREETRPHYSNSPPGMEQNANNERVEAYPQLSQEVRRYEGPRRSPNEKGKDCSYSFPTERGQIYEDPDRPTHVYREESSNSNMYTKSDGERSRRNSGGYFQGTGNHPMVNEQMTAVQALQLQINAAVNPAHRAALVLALQAITGPQVQSSAGEVPPHAKVSTIRDRQSDYKEVSDEGSSNRFHNDNAYKDPGNRKVEFTVVLRDDDEKLLRKDGTKKSRTGDTSKGLRPSYDDQKRITESSMKREQDSHYHRAVELSSDPHENPSQDAFQKDRKIYHQVSPLDYQKGRSCSTSSERANDRHSSSRERHAKASPEGKEKKDKKSVNKKSKKKAKDFHGRPLIKDRTNKTDPHSIPLENEDTVHQRIDPRRSVTPDPECGRKELRRLKWPRSKVKKHKQKDKDNATRSKPNGSLSGSRKLKSKKEETFEGISKRLPQNEKLVKESVAERGINTEAVGKKDEQTSDGKFQRQHKEAFSEVSDKPGQNTIENFVNEARLDFNKNDVESEEENYHSSGEIHGHCKTNRVRSKITKCSPVGTTSVDHSNTRRGSEDERIDTPRESFTPESSHSGGKKKRKSPDSKQYDYDDRHESRKHSPQKRKLSDRTPERHKKCRHTGHDKEKPRHKRKYSSDSESDIDSDRERVHEARSKLKRYGHFSRFSKASDWRSIRSGPLRPRSSIRSRTPFQRFDYRKYIYPGNLGKPYGNQRIISTYRGRGRGFLHGRTPVFTPWRERGRYVIDITKEVKNTPTMSMTELGYKDITPWQDIHVDLSEIKAKMLAVEKSSREVRKASSQLQVAPLLKLQMAAYDALECIMTQVSSRISYDRREMYLHRRKYEILMADIRVHAEALGKLIPPEQEEAMMAEFVPNITGIPRITPAIELKVMNWLSLMKNSGMLMAVRELIKKKIRSLQDRVDAMTALERRQSRRLDERINRITPRSRQWSGSDISPDTTRPEGEDHKDAEQRIQNAETSPEVLSCPEFGPSTPVTEVQSMPEAFSEIRLPTHYLVAYHDNLPEPSPSSAFRNPPEPVRRLISSHEENQELVDIPFYCDVNETRSFSLIDIPPNRDHRLVGGDQNAQPSQVLPIGFCKADSGSVNMTGTPQEMPLEHPLVSEVSCDQATPSGFVNCSQPATTPTHLSQPMFYISRVQRFASRTLMSPESGSDLQTLLKSEAEKNSKRNKVQRTPSSSDEQTSQGDTNVGKPEVKSPRYSKKRHFLAKFQSEGTNKSPKPESSKLELSSPRMNKNNLNKMYNEYEESCLIKKSAKESAKVGNQESLPPTCTSNAESLPSNVGS